MVARQPQRRGQGVEQGRGQTECEGGVGAGGDRETGVMLRT